MNDSWKLPKKKPPLHVPQPPAEGCPINSLPPEILSWIFILGQQMDLEPEFSYTEDDESDSDQERDDPARLYNNDDLPAALLNARDADKPLLPEPVPVLGDDQNNSDWEDENSDADSDHDDASSICVPVDNSFQVTVSHVCKLWRDVAFETPALWSEIDVETGRHAGPSYRRASAYLSRTKEYPLSISIDVDEWDPDDESVYSEQSDLHPPETTAQLNQIIDLLFPHISRWRRFKLVAENYYHIYTTLTRLCDAPPALLLETMELHHFDEELEPEHNFFPYPSHKTPFILFDNSAPKLRYLSLYGVHVDWHNTTFLKNLHSFELAYLSQDVRPSFEDFFTILRSSPGLRTLDLCMAGPYGFPHEWPSFLPQPPQDDHFHDPHLPAAFATQPQVLDEYMVLPRLHELKLSYQSPEDLVAFLNRVSMPGLHILEVNLEDHEYTEFVQSHLIDPPKWQGSSSRESRLVNLKELRIVQLACTPKAIADLYATLVNLETIDFDFNTLDEPFWEVFVQGKLPSVTTPANTLLPVLHTMRVKGSCGDVLRQIVEARVGVGLPLKKLFIDSSSDIERVDDRWLREKVEDVEYFEVSDDEYTDDEESVSSIIEMEMGGFHL